MVWSNTRLLATIHISPCGASYVSSSTRHDNVKTTVDNTDVEIIEMTMATWQSVTVTYSPND